MWVVDLKEEIKMFHSYLLGQITLVPESVAVSDSQEIFHYDSAKKRRVYLLCIKQAMSFKS